MVGYMETGGDRAGKERRETEGRQKGGTKREREYGQRDSKKRGEYKGGNCRCIKINTGESVYPKAEKKKKR